MGRQALIFELKAQARRLNEKLAGRSAAAHIRASTALRSERCTYKRIAQGSMAVRGTAEMMQVLVSPESSGIFVHADNTCRMHVQVADGSH